MKILMTGATGFIGTALMPSLGAKGHQLTRLVRSGSGRTVGEIAWDPINQTIDTTNLEGFDAFIHLAGESIATGRWTPAKKDRIFKSRVDGTRFLSQVLSRLGQPPKVFLCASAIGFYGNRADEVLNENSAAGSMFLSKVCQEWEAATEPATKKGIRVVSLRFGIILSIHGGALAKMLWPFRMGLGGKIGSGKQYMSWITLDDVVGVIQHSLKVDTLHGPVNVVTSYPVTNLEFTKILGRALSRPTLFPMPAFAARLAFGEMADELLLASTRVEPSQLVRTNYSFRHPELDGALRQLLA